VVHGTKSARITPRLGEAMLEVLSQGRPVLLLTTGADGFPSTAWTWALASGPASVRFGADRGSATLHNLERDPRAALQVIAEGGLVFLVKGRCRPLKPSLDAAAGFGIALWTLDVAEVRDQRWPGVRVAPLAFEWTVERPEEMLALERAVLAEMREWRE
jgi:hypothetical protein